MVKKESIKRERERDCERIEKESWVEAQYIQG